MKTFDIRDWVSAIRARPMMFSPTDDIEEINLILSGAMMQKLNTDTATSLDKEFFFNFMNSLSNKYNLPMGISPLDHVKSMLGSQANRVVFYMDLIDEFLTAAEQRT